MYNCMFQIVKLGTSKFLFCFQIISARVQRCRHLQGDSLTSRVKLEGEQAEDWLKKIMDCVKAGEGSAYAVYKKALRTF